MAFKTHSLKVQFHVLSGCNQQFSNSNRDSRSMLKVSVNQCMGIDLKIKMNFKYELKLENFHNPAIYMLF